MCGSMHVVLPAKCCAQLNSKLFFSQNQIVNLSFKQTSNLHWLYYISYTVVKMHWLSGIVYLISKLKHIKYLKLLCIFKCEGNCRIWCWRRTRHWWKYYQSRYEWSGSNWWVQLRLFCLGILDHFEGLNTFSTNINLT